MHFAQKNAIDVQIKFQFANEKHLFTQVMVHDVVTASFLRNMHIAIESIASNNIMLNLEGGG
jgi:hypothetical protein